MIRVLPHPAPVQPSVVVPAWPHPNSPVTISVAVGPWLHTPDTPRHAPPRPATCSLRLLWKGVRETRPSLHSQGKTNRYH
ncbi:hypothetical protein E2C01_097133 [Portunus trituberculatus]|uniref:Uncharacterized protein n=1 Tax=Portunus trituberculatus TaxID=210409 RepID=A0A5B7K962_PORTR|nr:hypothetical protein [Portunus trituberculatus]